MVSNAKYVWQLGREMQNWNDIDTEDEKKKKGKKETEGINLIYERNQTERH